MSQLRMPSLISSLAVLAVAAALSIPSGSWAQEDSAAELELARKSRAVAENTMSPFCLGRTLSDCPSPAAADERDRIHRWLASGVSEAEIKARLDREYAAMMAERGLSPTLSGVPKGTSGWLVPILVIAAGGAILIAALVRLQRKPAASAPVSGEQLRALEAELDAELAAHGIGGRPPRA